MSDEPTLKSDSLGDGLAALRAGAGVDVELARARVAARLLDDAHMPVKIGRYDVRRRIGQGGMGVVYTAHDPELDRTIAIKVLHGGGAGPQLLREANALARLQHPNVVAVYDVGTIEGSVFVAMELVEGCTLTQWLREERSIADVVAVMLQAGRGLAAAHRAQLVHRDFKPDNVMVGADGRVRVMDFGLAHEIDPLPSSEEAGTDAPELGASSRRIAGTPAYMAPEQFRGESIGAAADQFGFCVALWEALHGERPFGGDSLASLCEAVLEGRMSPPPAGAKVPRWLRRVVERGLATEAEQRWPAMDALVEAIERGRARARRRLATVVVAGIAIVAVAAVGVNELDEQRRIASCIEAGGAIEEAWNDDARARVQQAVFATQVSYAEATARAVVPWLDSYAQTWRSARERVCSDIADLDASLWCLEDRRLAFGALVTALAETDAQTVQRAVIAAAGLESIEPCVALTISTPPSVERRVDVSRVRERLSRAAALEAMGAYDQGLSVAREALRQAYAIDWPPLRAAAEVRVASLLDKTAAFEEAAALLESAYFEAMRADANDEAFAAANALVAVVGVKLARHADGMWWVKHTEVLLSRRPDPARLDEATSLNNRAGLHHAMGEYDRAAELFERVLAIWEEALGDDHPQLATALANLAAVRTQTGDYAGSEALYERALAIRETALGADHPLVASSVSGLAGVEHALGRYAEAKVLFERVLRTRERALGPEHPSVASAMTNVANVCHTMGEYAEALALHERALAIKEKALGLDHPEVATTMNNLANAHYALRRHAEAIALHERALGIRERVLGPEHAEVAESLSNLAIVHEAMEAYGEARAYGERAIAIQERTLGRDHPALAITLANLGNVQRARGAHAEARALYERAVAIREQAIGIDDPHLADPLLGLASLELEERHAGAALAAAERALKLRLTPDDLARARLLLDRARAAMDPL